MTQTTARQMSSEGLMLLKSIERCRLEPYDDQTGYPISDWLPGATIGFGHLIPKEDWHLYRNGITAVEAEHLLQCYLSGLYSEILRVVTRPLTQNEFDALTLLSYNIGIHNFSTSSVVKHLNGLSTKYPSLELAWKAWDKSQGRVVAGLVQRRQCEWDVFSAGIYKSW